MNPFFQVIKELSADKTYRTAVILDGEFAGKKAVLQEDNINFKSEGLPEDVCNFIKEQQEPGLFQTTFGRIFVEVLGNPKKLILCGGGHVSSATLSIAKMMDFTITVLEDRPDFARMASEHGADRVICDNFTEGLKQVVTDGDTYVVIMTRGHRHDLECLHELMKREYAYLGLMGSRSRVKKIKEQLSDEGFAQEKIDSLHAPVGLPIAAATPAEIAVSIMAEIIQEKNQKKRQECYEKEIAAWLFSEEEKKPAVLATIIARKGSAPRQTGTKMLVFADGSSLGTIGGGCMEAEVKGKARHLLAEVLARGGNDASLVEVPGKCSTCFVDMTAMDAEEEGMVCGGTLEIFMEVI